MTPRGLTTGSSRGRCGVRGERGKRHTMAHILLIDDDPAYFKASGRIGLQIEQYGLGKVNFREIWLKQISR